MQKTIVDDHSGNDNSSSASEQSDRFAAPTDRPAGTGADNATAPDPFNLAEIRQAQDFGQELGVRKTLKCKVRKPSKEWWITTHPDPEYRIEAWVIDLKEDGETYWVVPSLWPELFGEPTFIRKAFFTYTAKHTHKKGDYFLWPIRLPDEDGKLDDWNQSALEFARQSGKWQRIAANREMGEYDQYETDRNWEDPEWPDCPFDDLIRAAFKGKLIDSLDHPVIRNLRGE